MSDTLKLRRRLNESIEADIAHRVAVHRERIASMAVTRSFLTARAAGPMTEPLILLASGDSWFDYPLYGNGPLLQDTDIIAQMRSMGAVSPLVLNLSHFGDATTEELSLPKQQRLVSALSDPRNWGPGGKPDAILFSGGGDDIAGDCFCIYLNYNISGSTGLNQERFEGVLASVRASYEDLFTFRDQYAPSVPIFAHDYDFPIPNGAHPFCIGPWLSPSLTFRGWMDVKAGASIVRDALLQFRTLLLSLAGDRKNNFHLIDTQGTLSEPDWANELHPTPNGFKEIAAKVVAELAKQFPGRI